MSDETPGSGTDGSGTPPGPKVGGTTPAPPTASASDEKSSGPAPRAGFGARLAKGFGALQTRFFKVILALALGWYAIFNLPGFLNVLSALRLKKHKRCVIRGYTKFVYFYPIIPVSLICTGLHLLGAPTFPLAVAWTLVIFISALVAAEDIAGAAALGAMGFLVAILGIYVALLIAGHDINGWIKGFFQAFTPEFDPGMAMLLAVLLSVTFIVLYTRVSIKSVLRVDNNNYELKQIHRSTPYPALEWRLRGEVVDWAERLWMGAVNLKLLSNYGGGRGRAPSSGGLEVHDDDREAAVLANVPGGTIVDRLIWRAMSSFNVEAGVD